MFDDRKYLSINVIVLKLMGLFPLEGGGFFRQKIIVNVGRFLSVPPMMMTVLAMIYDIIEHPEASITDFSKHILDLGITFMVFFNMVYCYWNADKIKAIVDLINEEFMFSSNKGIVNKDMQYGRNRAKWVSICWYTFICTTCFYQLFPPVLGGKRSFPFHGWYPYNWTSTPNYELTYISQILHQMVSVGNYSSSDVFFCSVLIIAAAQFDILGCNFQNIVYTSLLNYGLSKKAVVKYSQQFNNNNTKMIVEDEKDEKLVENHIFNNGDFKAELDSTLRETIRHHQMMLLVCAKMESFFTPLLLIKVLASGFMLTFIAFAVVWSREEDRMGVIQYVFAITFEILFLTYHGSLVTTASEKLLDQLYSIPWYMCDESFKKTFNFMQMKCRKPFVLSGGKIFSLNFITFTNVFKASFSYFTVLQRVADRS